MAIVLLDAVVLCAGGYIYYEYTFPGRSWGWLLLMSLQNCAESLLFNPVLTIQDVVENLSFSHISGIGTCLIRAYSIAMVLTPLIDVFIIFSVVDSFLHIFAGIRFKKTHILIVGYNDDVLKVIERRNKNEKVYLWTENYLPVEEERRLYFKKVSVKMNDFSLGDDPEEYAKQKEKLDRFIRRKGITYVLLLDRSDIKNNQYYMALSSCDICKERTIHFMVLNKSFEAQNFLQDYFDKSLSKYKNEKGKIPPDLNTHMDLRILNYDQIQTEAMFNALPVFAGNRTGENHNKINKDVHFLIAGSGTLSLSIALHAMNQAVFSPDNRIIIDIVTDNTDTLVHGFRERFNKELVLNVEENIFEIPSDKIDGLLKIRLTKCSIMDPGLSSILTKLRDSEDVDFTYIALCSKNADENVHVFQCIEKNGIIRDGKCVPVSVRMAFTEEMKKYMESFSWCREALLMGEDGEYIGLDHIINIDEENRIRDYHLAYGAVSDVNIWGETINSNAFDKETGDRKWNGLEYYKRQSNRALYHHKKVKEVFFLNDDFDAVMHEFWKKNVKNTDNGKDLHWSKHLISDDGFTDLLEMAKTEHRRWSYFFAGEGWGYSAGKKPELRLHDCLCTWEKLVETKPDVLIYDLISSPALISDIKQGRDQQK